MAITRATARLAIGGMTVAALALSSCGTGESTTSAGKDQAKIVLLIEKAGESAYAVDDFYNGFTMAVEEINAKGGVNGKKLVTERFPSPPTDPQGAVQSVQKAAGADPTVIIGMPAQATIRAALPQIAQTGVPFIHLSYGDLAAKDIEAAGGKLFQPLGPDEHGLLPENAATYAVEKLGAKRIGIMYVDLDLGNHAKAVLKKQIEELGADVVAERSYPVTATDLTQQVLAMKQARVDAVIDWGYPNQIAVQLQQFEQNGLTGVPTVGGTSSDLVAQNKLAGPELLKGLYGSVVCNPAGDHPDWAADYKKEFGVNPAANAAFTYDMVHLAKAAIEKAGSTDPESVTKALKSIKYTDGVCLPEYANHGDANVLSEGGVIAHFGEAVAKTVFQR